MARQLPRAPKLQRNNAQRDQRPVVHVYCEGSITEPRYIENFYRDLPKRRVMLNPVIKGAGEPLTIVRSCIEGKKRWAGQRMKGLLDRDSFWAVFDRDEHQYFHDAIRLAHDNGIRVAISNPCVEIWGLLHERCCDAPMSRHEAQRELAAVMPGYHHDRNPEFSWEWCRGRIATARVNADRVLANREREGTPFPVGVPLSNFHQLLDTLAGL